MVRLILLGSALFLWLIALLFLGLSANDVIYFQPGRERWFALALNAAFLALVVFLIFGARPDFHRHPKSACSILIFFAAALILTGAWIPLVASVSGPPWEDRLTGMPVSANSPFMDSVWAWEVGAPSQSPPR